MIFWIFWILGFGFCLDLGCGLSHGLSLGLVFGLGLGLGLGLGPKRMSDMLSVYVSVVFAKNKA